MSSRLSYVTNWEERARDARFRVSTLASGCGVSRRRLQTFVRESFGMTAHAWMLGMRMERAAILLREGLFVKEVAAEVGFKQVTHFCREFKRYHGVSPGHFSIATVSIPKKFPFR